MLYVYSGRGGRGSEIVGGRGHKPCLPISQRCNNRETQQEGEVQWKNSRKEQGKSSRGEYDGKG